MKIILICAGIIAVFAVLWVFRRTDLQQGATADRPEDPDRQVLKQLIAAGSDLTKPHDVEFFLYFPDEARASMACQELIAEGYAGKVDRAAAGPGWRCFATKRVVPSHAAMVAIRHRLNEVARAGSGEYDGWGTQVAR